MKQIAALLLIVGLLLSGCAGAKPFDYFGTEPKPFTPTEYQAKVADFGGFTGSCASDENFPYYWECMSENAGDSGDDGSGDGE